METLSYSKFMSRYIVKIETLPMSRIMSQESMSQESMSQESMSQESMSQESMSQVVKRSYIR
jgi:hypothetical protein